MGGTEWQYDGPSADLLQRQPQKHGQIAHLVGQRAPAGDNRREDIPGISLLRQPLRACLAKFLKHLDGFRVLPLSSWRLSRTAAAEARISSRPHAAI